MTVFKSDLHNLNRWLCIAAVCCLMISACATTSPGTPGVAAEQIAAAEALIPLTSAEGERLFYGSTAKHDFLPLSVHFVSQQNLAYCGVASIAMVLNALNIPAPIDPAYIRFPMFTQNNLFNANTERVVGPETVARQGMTLDQLGGLLAAYPVEVKVFHSSDSSLDQFRKLAAKNLQQRGNFILVNYLRKSLGQQTGGHISPLGAYDQASDRFLILDVARFKYPPVWVKAEHLWQAMNTLDKDAGKNRGFVIITDLGKQ